MQIYSHEIVTLFSAPPGGAKFCSSDQVFLLKLSFSMRRGEAFLFVVLFKSLRMGKRRQSHAEKALFKVGAFMQGDL
jgi:hypothetical protein